MRWFAVRAGDGVKIASVKGPEITATGAPVYARVQSWERLTDACNALSILDWRKITYCQERQLLQLNDRAESRPLVIHPVV